MRRTDLGMTIVTNKVLLILSPASLLFRPPTRMLLAMPAPSLTLLSILDAPILDIKRTSNVNKPMMRTILAQTPACNVLLCRVLLLPLLVLSGELLCETGDEGFAAARWRMLPLLMGDLIVCWIYGDELMKYLVSRSKESACCKFSMFMLVYQLPTYPVLEAARSCMVQ